MGSSPGLPEVQRGTATDELHVHLEPHPDVGVHEDVVSHIGRNVTMPDEHDSFCKRFQRKRKINRRGEHLRVLGWGGGWG